MDKYKGFRTNRHEGVHPLKYYRIVRKFFAKQQGLEVADLELLIQLDDEYFTKARFKEASMTSSWKVNRLESLEERGWIELWRPHKPPRQSAIYKPTGKSHRLVGRIYKILAGEEDLPTSTRRNPLERSDEFLSYSEKILRNAVRVMNDRRNNKNFK